MAAASLSAGTLQHQFGWQTINLGVLPLLSIMLISLLWLKFNDKPIAHRIDELAAQENEA